MKNLLNTLTISLIIILVFSGCKQSGNQQNTTDDTTKTVDLSKYGLDTSFVNKLNTIKAGEVGDIIQSFPSPVEMAALIEDMKVPFAKKYLFSTDAANGFDTNFKKALALGVYSADLGYLNVYGRTGEVIQYLVTIRRISDDLRIGQFFDFQTLKRLATNNTNLDSLLILSVQSYHNMDEYLRTNDRSNLSALMVTGVWFESLYLAGQVYKESPNAEMLDRIGSQKNILASLMAVLVKFINTDENFALLIGEFKELYLAYKDVEIEIIEKEDTETFINGVYVKTQGSTSIVKINEQQINRIIAATEKIKSKIESSLK